MKMGNYQMLYISCRNAISFELFDDTPGIFRCGGSCESLDFVGPLLGSRIKPWGVARIE